MLVRPLAVMAVLAACRRDAPAPAPPPPVVAAEPDAAAPVAESPPPPRVLPDVKTDWCLEGWRGLDETSCYLLPDVDGDGGAEPTELLVYLAGIVPQTPVRSTSKEHVQRVVGNVARRARVVALLPRGRLGIGPKDAKDWWAWPTTAGDYQKLASSLVAEWAAERRALEAALGYEFKRVYLAGSSSGAYFATMLAFAGAFTADGFGAMSGGAPGAGIPPVEKRPPFYVGWGEADPSSGGAKALSAILRGAGWPMKATALSTGHGARETYLEEAIAFWRSRT